MPPAVPDAEPDAVAPRLARRGARWVELEGCFNFRDLGGYQGAGGRPVRWGMLYRADGLQRLTAADLGTLHALGLRSVIDLRTAAEVDERGRIPDWPGLCYHHLPMFDVLPPEDQLAHWERAAFVASEYRRMLEAGAPTIARVLGLLCEAQRYPVVYHCFAGKDRTGITTAVLLELLGVADTDIVADYALSQDAMARMLAALRRRHPERAAELDAAEAAITRAEPAAMEAFLARFRAEHGGAAELAASLGLPGAAERLRELLLEPSPG